MEAEERAAQSAKLQELVRRGTPHDLQEANKLMKIMAGYDTRHKTDYRAKAAEEVAKIQQKAKILEEMLQGHQQGDEIKEGDVFEELANALASAHPKIQRMCEEESDDTEAVAKLFEINDSIHRTIERYKLIKKGDIEGANAIPKGTLGTSGAGVKKGANNELSLIDFGGDGEEGAEGAEAGDMLGGEPAAGEGAVPASKGNALEDDLLGLNMGDGNYGQGGGISLGAPPAPGPSSNGASTMDIMSQFNQPAEQSMPKAPTPSIFTQPPQQQMQQPTAGSTTNYDPFSALSQPASKSATPVPSIFSSGQAPQHQAKKSDPFAALATPPRGNSPAQFQSSTKPPQQPAASKMGGGGASADLLGGGSSSNAAAADDEWAFSSALPDQPTDIVVTNSAIKTVFAVTRPSDSELTISSRITNSTSQSISDLTFQLAVTKVNFFNTLPRT